MNSSVSYNPSIKSHVSNTSAEVPRAHNVQNLECGRRANCGINVTVIAKPDSTVFFAKSEAEKEVNRLRSLYVVGQDILQEQYDIITTDSIKSVTINAAWSFGGTIES